MANELINSAIQESTRLTVQKVDGEVAGRNVFIISNFARAGELIAPWWSPLRDSQLRTFSKNVDYLSGAVYTMVSKLISIPVKIIARNMNNKSQVREAERQTNMIQMVPGFGEGWTGEYGMFVEDLLTQDNGGFMEIIGPGYVDGPIIGAPVSFSHLDSARCQRTGNPIYPVIYQDLDGVLHKIHFSRIMFNSIQKSPIREMLGVGFCSVSRCTNVAQTLLDILIYKQEKLGSRPHRQLIITQGGLDPKDLQTAFEISEEMMDSQNLQRYSKVVVGGSQTLPEADLKVIDLSSMPDGFNEETSIMLGMATIALAFGTDARELFPSMGAGATRADALLQHLKQRGKGPGQILQLTENLMNYKYLPPYLQFQADFQDDAQDRQTAEIRGVRANTRVQTLASGAADERALRLQMYNDGEITREQLERLELDSGRLENGDNVLSLFFSNDANFRRLLKLPGVDNPLDTKTYNPDYILMAIADQKAAVYDLMVNGKSEDDMDVAHKANAALTQLELLYMPAEQQLQEEKNAIFQQSSKVGNNPNDKKSPDATKKEPPPNKGDIASIQGANYVDPRIRRVNLTVPTSSEESYGQALSMAGSSGE